MSIGDEILAEIIKEDLVQAECEGVCVWKANTAEVLEAIVMKHVPAMWQMGHDHLREGGDAR